MKQQHMVMMGIEQLYRIIKAWEMFWDLGRSLTFEHMDSILGTMTLA